jgi:hypothetical protein
MINDLFNSLYKLFKSFFILICYKFSHGTANFTDVDNGCGKWDPAYAEMPPIALPALHLLRLLLHHHMSKAKSKLTEPSLQLADYRSCLLQPP